MSRYYNGFPPYVPVAERRRKAELAMARLAKKGQSFKPVRLNGRTIAHTFWGKAWCDNLESYMDFENRLPRGRTYVRNGSVVHLEILPGEIQATVSGSSLYRIKIEIVEVAREKWKKLCKECVGGIGSLIELLQGRFSQHVMKILTCKDTGLFPSPKEIKMSCSCPDWAVMCKHVAAVLYGVGARLDESPELLFTLRSVKQEELISQAASVSDLAGKGAAAGPEIEESELGAVFGIELDSQTASATLAESLPAEPPQKPAAPKKAVKAAKSSGTQSKSPKSQPEGRRSKSRPAQRARSTKGTKKARTGLV